MKKLTLILIGLAMMLMPMVASAGPAAPTDVDGCDMRYDFSAQSWSDKGFDCPDPDPAADGPECLFSSEEFTCGSCCLLNTIYTITDWIFILVTALVTIMVVIGGYHLITAAGDPGKIDTGKKYVLWASIGFIVALAAKAIPSIARAILGV